MEKSFKEKVYTYYLLQVMEKVKLLNDLLNDLKEMGANETKSTAGDKHETSLAMLQIEQANIRTQLTEIQSQESTLTRINPLLTPISICMGSLVKTNRCYFFLSVALGKATIEGESVIALSPQSPMGNQLLQSALGQTIAINGLSYTILEIK